MLRWPIRLKLMVGLGLVVGMMLILLGGSIFGLHSFHISNLTLGDQLREIGASTDLFDSVFRLHAPRDGMTDDERADTAPPHKKAGQNGNRTEIKGTRVISDEDKTGGDGGKRLQVAKEDGDWK